MHRSAQAVLATHARLDMVINNAAVFGTRQPASVSAGVGRLMATNYLGHFVLTSLLLDRIVTTERSRVVTVTSSVHRIGRIRLDDVGGATPRGAWPGYAASKLAGVLFALELARRLEACHLSTASLAADPGWSRSSLLGNGTAFGRGRVPRALARAIGATLGQSTEAGALPVLCAATSSSVRSGQHVGPGGAVGLIGPPRVSRPSARARNTALAAALWQATEELTDVHSSLDVPV